MSAETPRPPGPSLALPAGLAVLVLGAGAFFYLRQPDLPPPPPPPVVPSAVASPVAVSPPPTAAPVVVEPPSGKPVSTGKAPVAEKLARADKALASGQFDSAERLFDEALKADPKNPKALTGKVNTFALRRSFAADRTQMRNLKGVKGEVEGFDATLADVQRAVKIPGRLEFSVEPRRLKPGDNYVIRVSLVNEGSDSIKIKLLNVATTINGRRSAGPVEPMAKEIASRQNEVLLEAKGVWKEDVTSWGMEVSVTSRREDFYRNHLAWK